MKTIYKPKGAAGEYAKCAVNFYNGCSNGCEYCYLKRGVIGKACGGNVPTLQKKYKDETDALQSFVNDIGKAYVKLAVHGLFFTFTSDPFLPETFDLNASAIRQAAIHEIPCTVLTKRSEAVNFIGKALCDYPYMEKRFKQYIAFGFTLTGHDELEPGASTNADRIEAMKKLHDAGFKTWASIEPIIDVPSSMRVIEESLDVCDHYKVGLRSGVKKDYYDSKELYHFLCWLTNIAEDFKKPIYIKDSYREMFDGAVMFDEDSCVFVNKDYSIFKK